MRCGGSSGAESVGRGGREGGRLKRAVSGGGSGGGSGLGWSGAGAVGGWALGVTRSASLWNKDRATEPS